MKNKFRLSLMTCAFALAMASSSLPLSAGAAGLQSQMDKVFDSMINVTAPQAYESQRRGVIGGGSVYVRNRIMNTSIASFVPPKMEASCAGLDMFGGSFSFIDADEFVSLLQSIASNAAGYAFQLALETVSPDINAIIQKLQSTIQALNQYAGNSCQLAQGIVNDTWNAISDNKVKGASIVGMTEGLYKDVANTWKKDVNVNKDVEKKMSQASKEKLYGNLVWQSLTKNNVKGWFKAGTGATADLEMLMSLTGSYISNEPKTNTSEGSDGEAKPSFNPVPPILDLKDLIFGATDARVYKCDDSNRCMNPRPQTQNIEGFQKKFARLLVGGTDAQNQQSIGIVGKYARDTENAEFTNDEKAFIDLIPQVLSPHIRNVSAASELAGKELARNISTAMAIYVASVTATEFLNAVETAVASSDDPLANKALESVRKRYADLQNEIVQLKTQFPDVWDLASSLESVSAYLEKNNVAIQTAPATRTVKN